MKFAPYFPHDLPSSHSNQPHNSGPLAFRVAAFRPSMISIFSFNAWTRLGWDFTVQTMGFVMVQYMY